MLTYSFRYSQVEFEKENIWTFDGKGELLITIMSSLAQEESRSISGNCTLDQRKRFADGKVSVPFSRFLGYDRGPNGELVINHEEAKTIKEIYRLFLQGQTPYGIAKQLTSEGILTPGGKTKWSVTTVKGILKNEKYKGDALLQKSYTVDYLTKITKMNEGEIPQYYVEGDHEAIIEPAIFDQVQIELERRCPGRNRHSGVHDFSGMIKCGQCGSWYGSKVWHSTSKYRKMIWQCNHKFDGGKKCTTPHLTDDEIKTAFVSAATKKQRPGLTKSPPPFTTCAPAANPSATTSTCLNNRTDRFRNTMPASGMVDHVTVFSKEDIRFTMKDGTEIRA